MRRLDAAFTKDPHTHCDEAENLTGSRTKSAEEKKKTFVQRDSFDKTENLSYE